ncbi:Sec20 [Dillenia turbinata]|uniref:Sec20 n=1 Tax=Dillenia turbinata TaxID=194707 RepID=A0AAN8UJZ4_9MAGN
MDEVAEEVERVKKKREETVNQTRELIRSIEEYGKKSGSDRASEEKNSLQRLNGLAQDGLALLESLRLNLRNANLRAKANMRKAAQEERKLLLGGGRESTIRRHNLQTKAGMTSAAESITESLRRTRQLMVQVGGHEVERSTSTLMTFEESTSVLKKAESEYKGHRSLLMRTRNLLSTMQRQDVLDRLILIVGFVLFSCAVLYVVSKRIGILTLQRKVTAAIKAGMVGQGAMQPRPAGGDLNLANLGENAVPKVEVPPLEPIVHEEL